MLLSFFTLIGDEINSLLQYQRNLILQGEVWRLMTCHLVHVNINHGIMNLLAIALIVLVFGSKLTYIGWLSLIAFLGLFISLCLLFFSPDIVWYLGFSGITHGLLVFALIKSSLSGDKLHIFALLLIILKIGREQLPNFDIYHLSAYISAPVVVDSHLYGAIGGAVFIGVISIISRLQKVRISE